MSEETRDEAAEFIRDLVALGAEMDDGDARDAVDALTAHIMDEVRAWHTRTICNAVAFTPEPMPTEAPLLSTTVSAPPHAPPAIPPPVERMGEDRLAHLCNFASHLMGYEQEELATEARRAREAETGLREEVKHLTEIVDTYQDVQNEGYPGIAADLENAKARIAQLEKSEAFHKGWHDCHLDYSEALQRIVERLCLGGAIPEDDAIRAPHPAAMARTRMEEIAQLERDLATAKRELGDMTLDRDCMRIELDTARELLNEWTLAIGLTPIVGNKEVMQEMYDKTRAFLAGKESDND